MRPGQGRAPDLNDDCERDRGVEPDEGVALVHQGHRLGATRLKDVYQPTCHRRHREENREQQPRRSTRRSHGTIPYDEAAPKLGIIREMAREAVTSPACCNLVPTESERSGPL